MLLALRSLFWETIVFLVLLVSLKIFSVIVHQLNLNEEFGGLEILHDIVIVLTMLEIMGLTLLRIFRIQLRA